MCCIYNFIIVYPLDLLIKNMNYYEHTVILRQDVSSSQQNQIIEKYKKIIEKNNGKIMLTQIWGLMNLSYIIKKNKKGLYVHFKIEGEGSLIKDLEKNEKIDKNILKYLTIKVKKHDLDTNYFAKKEITKEKDRTKR